MAPIALMGITRGTGVLTRLGKASLVETR
jgi:hypothetical protein